MARKGIVVKTEITVNKVPKIPEWPESLREAMLGVVLAGCNRPDGFAVVWVTIHAALMKKGVAEASLFMKNLPLHVNHFLFKKSGKIEIVPFPQ
ncbi:MAG: hypothetical protein WCS97_02200 [Candidatus Paceibacterota bacterium]|jgi:hypothetical protein